MCYIDIYGFAFGNHLLGMSRGSVKDIYRQEMFGVRVKLEAENIFHGMGFHIGETVLKDGMMTYMHTHDFFELFLIEEGEVRHYINGGQSVMRKGDIYFVRPEDEHCFQRGNCKKAQFVNMAFSDTIFQKAEEMANLCFDTKRNADRMEIHLPPRMELAVQSKMAFLARDKTSLTLLTRQDLVISILLDCLLILHSQENYEESVPEWLQKACQRMRQNQNYLNGLETFIEIAGKSQEHLTRCMKKYYHVTPTEYINRIRLEQTTILLETTDDSILDIMLECGFNNVSHFNQLFKKNYGLTPSRYRALNHSVINPA